MIDKINQSTYTASRVVRYFENINSLQPTEQVIFDRIASEVKDKPILDIGVGAGRTISYLTKISRYYTGIDYSKKMIESCKKRFPQVNLVNLDARDLSNFPSESFFFVLFSFNGIDCIDHSDRITIFTEIYRVLQKGGYFVFSSHNRDYYNCHSTGFRILQSPGFNSALDPIKFSYYAISFLPGIFKRAYNRLKNKKFETHNQEYSIINDPAHNYSLLIYHISISEQVTQLVRIGFSEKIEAYDNNGQFVLTDLKSPWIYYVARKEAS